ncbi:5'-methylthioadenosine/S-adenosylhomocysteine nucleosidase [Nocardiopsis sp. HUAS JQ3]|uniref:5'-methylthioadenosine/S-adenosylhomocysteine nucleosidase family protein n=1 Tax=Nocardiopsis sp. HUAS JQ3 TaxID=3061629 RepID=UPI0023A92DD9|nr:5'-methylthioadenosine/S-adenosylhomocysteine nucleosidase [Nocardiopsis sp. HUAS JQ3]WDZ90096.1 5'-methylthioadenosine/S-adenosylhomocysteine nucleosidase [Nocardiopsis sp. HUAS JQ3]
MNDNHYGAHFSGGEQTISGGDFSSHTVVNPAHPDRAPSHQRTAGRDGNRSGPTADAVVITALASEYTAVARHLSDASGEVNARGTLFRTGTLNGFRRTRRVALAQVGPGNVGAGVHVERALTTFDPGVILFVGVAGGLKEDVRLGDVVVADAIYDYETGKDDEEDFRPRAKTAAPSNDAVQRARTVVTDGGWQRRSLAAPRVDAPRAFVKPIAAGSTVVGHERSRTAERLRRYCGDALAVEMEGYGFLHGAYLSFGTHALVIRGISDMLSDKTPGSDDFWQPVAAAHAAAFACEFLDLFGSEA